MPSRALPANVSFLLNIEDHRCGRPTGRAGLRSHLHVPRLDRLPIEDELLALRVLDRLVVVSIAQAQLSLLTVSLLLISELLLNIALSHVETRD